MDEFDDHDIEARSGFFHHLSDALERLKTLASTSPERSTTFARWAVVAGALQQLGWTLIQVVQHLVRLSTDEDVELMPPDLAAELRGDLDAIATSFPGADELIFGTDAIDDLIRAAIEDDGVREAAKRAGDAVAMRFDAAVQKLVTLAFVPERKGPSSEEIAGYLQRVERVLGRLLDYWLAEARLTERA